MKKTFLLPPRFSPSPVIHSALMETACRPWNVPQSCCWAVVPVCCPFQPKHKAQFSPPVSMAKGLRVPSPSNQRPHRREAFMTISWLGWALQKSMVTNTSISRTWQCKRDGFKVLSLSCWVLPAAVWSRQSRIITSLWRWQNEARVKLPEFSQLISSQGDRSWS